MVVKQYSDDNNTTTTTTTSTTTTITTAANTTTNLSIYLEQTYSYTTNPSSETPLTQHRFLSHHKTIQAVCHTRISSNPLRFLLLQIKPLQEIDVLAKGDESTRCLCFLSPVALHLSATGEDTRSSDRSGRHCGFSLVFLLALSVRLVLFVKGCTVIVVVSRNVYMNFVL
ncbi:hypothetical protein E2C01_094616 [Portunus trituberculatus]|uniref:Uncharacterized protein n=1 Tax=Portunus trituberculatus TaxID=210409 RepID=A0A5B7JY43_PORTR|nr:hypothetical protein [Portunus trituberculatus]